MDRNSLLLTGVNFCSLDDNIDLIDIQEESPDIDINTSDPLRNGGRLATGFSVGMRTIKITFAVSITDRSARRAVIAKINKLAMCPTPLTFGGTHDIEYLDRPGQHFVGYCSKLADMSSMNYADTLSLEFVSMYPWFATDNVQTSVAGPGSFVLQGAAIVDTDFPVPLQFHITNTSATTLTTLTVKHQYQHGGSGYSDRSIMYFTGLSIPQNGFIQLGYSGSQNLQYINSTNGDMLSKRTGADELLLLDSNATDSSYNRIVVTANTPANSLTCLLYWKGRKL